MLKLMLKHVTWPLTLNRPGYLQMQIGMAGERQILPLPICNFRLNGPIDLKLGIYIEIGNVFRYWKKIEKRY